MDFVFFLVVVAVAATFACLFTGQRWSERARTLRRDVIVNQERVLLAHERLAEVRANSAYLARHPYDWAMVLDMARADYDRWQRRFSESVAAARRYGVLAVLVAAFAASGAQAAELHVYVKPVSAAPNAATLVVLDPVKHPWARPAGYTPEEVAAQIDADDTVFATVSNELRVIQDAKFQALVRRSGAALRVKYAD